MDLSPHAIDGAVVRRLRRERTADHQDRRNQQLQGAAGLSRSLQERLESCPGTDQRRRRRARQKARSRFTRRQRQPRRHDPRRAGTDRAGTGAAAVRWFPVEHGARAHRLREAEENLLPCRRTVDRQDRLGGRQQIHVSPASFHVHAGCDARARSGQAEEEALGAGLSELRVRTIGGRHFQEAVERRAA